MKNRIIAVFLAFIVLVGSLSITKRAYAVPAALGVGYSIFVVALELLDLMIKGEEPGIVQAIRSGIEVGQEAFENGVDSLEHILEIVSDPDSPYQQTYSSFWDDFGSGFEAILYQVQEWYENGEIIIENGYIKFSYDQYKDLYDITYSFVPNIGVEFTTPYHYFAFSYTPGSKLPFLNLPSIDYYYYYYFSSEGQSYALCFYDDDKVVFADNYAIYRNLNDYINSMSRCLNSYYNWFNTGYSEIADSEIYFSGKYSFGYTSLSQIDFFYSVYNDHELHFTSTNCFVFENGLMTYKPISSVDLTGCSSAIVSSTGDYGAFLQSISAATSVDPVAAELDDLSSVLPVEENPVLSIPTSPDLAVPIADQVTVSVPGEVDAPLSDYMNPVLTDVSVPSVILTKFPFCIPYGFIRFLGFLAADPIAPVFRIPISTHPSNLEQWADNETIGDLVSPDDPMFDIDEEIVIDFAHIPLVQPICYTVFIVGFVIMLIKLTSKLIQH